MTLFERMAGAAEIGEAFSDAAVVAAMLRFEVEVAQAQAAVGLIPLTAAQTIAQAAHSFCIDTDTLVQAGAHAGTLAVPFVKALRAHVAKQDRQASDYVHFGATSQDVIDTAMVLCTQITL